MTWGEVELEPEVVEWFDALSHGERGTAAFYIDLLAERGVLLGEPYTRQLHGKLRELRFHLDRESVRVTYWIAAHRRIILLTVFRKRRMREQAEIERARMAMERCIAEAHSAEEGDKG
ncbi:type II toxin-antitoxin system RelE/ParE family toxin [Streptomyces sp. 891-h]|uniref:type II toxin-antitoxin system RelE/ParE family toxin n=1 Tax=unclassified Streptomyces TaxID=2593676 RepID=UPI001FAA61D6|nr:type II toxin-antitoxin system RelE/ParE family toxin [Streptomyces sp. 891-h]UNZ19964.1 type II toxin-antitoxin system RelE/ParE family toxin [Streptomyces sp. 891-h]